MGFIVISSRPSESPRTRVKMPCMPKIRRKHLFWVLDLIMLYQLIEET
jgi:hypothetical protein